MSVFKEFKNITGFDLPCRQTNYLGGYSERKDSAFSHMAILYFSDRGKFKRLKKKIKDCLKKEQTETALALAGYISYIIEDFKAAKKYFLKAVSLNPDNLDNWMDLAFALRHLGEYNISKGILFNYFHVIYYYKYFRLEGSNYKELKNMILEIKKKSTWQK